MIKEGGSSYTSLFSAFYKQNKFALLMYKPVIFLVLLTLFTINNSYSQNSNQDSLREVIYMAGEDSVRVNTLIELANSYRRVDTDKLIKLALEAKDISIRIGYQKGLANSLKYIGLGYGDQNMYVEATQNWEEALKIFEQLGDKDGTANILGNLGVMYSDQGDDEKALELYLRSLKIAE